MDWQIRSALLEDAHGLAELSLMAGHGFLNVLYENVFPGRRLEDIIVERRILKTGSMGHLRHWLVAAGTSGSVLGAVNFFSPEALDEIAADDAVPADRKVIFEPFQQLDSLTADSLHINMLAVFPEHRGHSIAEALVGRTIDIARAAGLPAVTLLTFEEDTRLVDYYHRLGFVTTGRSPVVPHQYFQHSGNIIAMSKPVD